MANPLTFEFGIKDNLSAKLEEIEKKLGKLQEGVAVNIRLGDVGSIKELFDNLDPSKINNITEAIKNLNRAMNVVVDKQGSFKTVRQFVDAEQAARNLASAVEKIDFGKVDNTGRISNMTNEMKAFRDALRDYNEKMANVQPFKAELSTQALAEFKSSIDKTLSGISVKLGVELDNKTITKDFGIYKGINEAVDYLKKNFSTVNAEVVAPKVDTTALDAAEKKVAELRKELAELQGEPVKPAVDSSQIEKANTDITKQEALVKSLKEAWDSVCDAKSKVEQAKANNVIANTKASDAAKDVERLDNLYKQANSRSLEAQDKLLAFTDSRLAKEKELYDIIRKVHSFGKDGFLSLDRDQTAKVLEAYTKKGLAMSLEDAQRQIKGLLDGYSTIFKGTSQFHTNFGQFYLVLERSAEGIKQYNSQLRELQANRESSGNYTAEIAKQGAAAQLALSSAERELVSTKQQLSEATTQEVSAQQRYNAEVAKGNQTLEQASAKLAQLKAERDALQNTTTPAPDNSARINQINEQITAQEKLIAENKKAQEQMKAPLQDATPFNAFSQGFTLAATEIYNAYNTIEKKLREVREALGETGFTNLKTKAEAAATAISKLSEAFEKLGVSFEANKELKNMLVGLGEIVSKIRQAIPAGDASGLGTQDIAENVRKNRDSIAKALYDIQRAREKVFEAKSIGQDNGMTAPQLNKLEMYIQYLDSYAKKLREVSQDSARMTMPNAVGDVIDKMARTRIGAADGLLREAKDCESASNRMKEAFLQIDSMRERLALKRTAGNGIINTSEIERQMRELDDFKAKLMGIGNVKTRVKVFGGEWSQMSKQMEGVLQRSERLIENTKKYNNNLDAGTVVVEKLKNAIQNASDPKLSIDTTAAQNALAKIEQWMQKLGNVDFNNPNAFVELERQFKRLKSEGNNAAKEIERAFNRATTTKDSYGDISHQIEFMKRQMLSISDLMAKAGKFNIDTTALAKFNSELEKSIRMLEQAQASGNKKQMSSAWLSSKTISDQATTEQRRVQNEVNKAKADGAAATQKLTAEEQKLADAIKNATNAGKQQNQVLSDLRTMAMQYWSVQGAYNFAKEMANITGELELQKTSLQVILNNASKADELYGQIRDLSQMSPFSFMDLMKSTRQLAAFGIETKDLYGTMKSLSDIGAGLNVDVNRLILAYGHTRSYGYLSGIQNRQFENAGIDMIGGLVKKYNELAEAEKKAGREAEYVSRKDIFKKMRNKEIGFGMVEDVVMDLDRPGGKFYNMQEKQFDTLGGKLRNLANNYNIMMSELGEKNRGVLMFAVEALTEVHENWRRYERIIYGVVAALGAMKAAQLAVGASAMSMNKAVSKFNLQNKKDIASTAILRGVGNGKYGAFSAGDSIWRQGSLINSGRVSDAVLKKEIIDNEKLTALQKQRIALTGKLSQAQRAQVLQATGLNAVEAKRIAGMNTLNRGLIAMRLNIQSVAMSLKAFATSFAPMAAITAIIALFMKFNEAAEQAKNIKEAFKNDSQKDLEGLREAISTYEKSGAVTTTTTSMMYRNGSVSVPVKLKFDTNKIKEMGVTEVFDELQRTLQSQSPLYQGDMFDIVKAGDQMKQIEAMFKRLKDIDFVKQMEQIHADALGDAIEDTGAKWYNVIDWFRKGEGIATNFGDFSKANKEFVKAFKVDDTVFDGIDKEYKDAINNLMKSSGMIRDEAIAKFVVDLQKQNKSAALKLTRQLLGGNKDTLLIKRNVQLDEAAGDMKPVAEHMAAAFADMNTDQATIYFEDAMNKIFTEAKVGDEDSRSVLRLKMAEAIKASMPEDEGAEFFNNVLKKNIGALVLENINGKVNQNTKASELPNIVNESFDKAIKTIKARTPEYAEAYAKAGKEGEKAFKEAAVNAAKRIMAMEDWQARAKKMNVTLDVTMDTDYTTFIDKQRKELKEKLEKFTKNQKRIKWIVGADLKLELNAKSVKETLKKLTETYNELAKKESDTIRTKRDKNGLIHGEDWKNVQQIRGQRETLKEMIDNLKTMARIGDYMDEEHQSWKDDTKNKGNQKDHMQEMWRNRIKYIQEAYNAYKQWKKEVGDNDVNGEDPAMKIVDNKFGKYLKEAFDKDFDLKNIKEYQKFLKEMMKMVENTTFKQEDTKRNFLSQLEGMYSQTELAVIQEKSKEVADAFKQNITDIEKKYEMFRSIIEVTGDTDLASRMLGYDYQWQNKADLIKRKLDKVLENAGLVGKINVNPTMSDTDIENAVKMNMRTVDDKGNPIEGEIKKVNEVVEALKKFRDVTQEVMKDSISQYTELIKSATGYQQKITDIETEYKKALEALKGIENETERNRAEGIARDKRDTALMEASAPYRNLMSNSLTTSKESARQAYATAYAQYSQNFKDGVIGADEYTKKIQELNKALRDIDNGAVSEWILFLQGGMKAVREQRIKRDDEIIASAMRDKEVAQKEYDDAKAKNDAKAMGIALGKMAKADSKRKTAEKDKSKNEQKVDSSEKFNKGVNAVVDGLNKFVSGLNLVNSTLDALGLGDTGLGRTLKSASTIASGAMQGAQALSFAGPWGMAAGAALGVVGGIMQVHDQALDKKIDELKKDVAKIENYEKILKKSNERQLGYGTTALLQEYKSKYQSSSYGSGLYRSSNSSSINNAMNDLYGNTSTVSAYAAEYQNAIEKREKYIEMYETERKKKNSDENAMEEYKAKIAELDDEIRFFAEDTAKALWGIDFKSWAEEFGDALSSAWENGTSLAVAYGDTVKSVMQNMLKQMMIIGVLEPLFERLRTALFGENGEGGLFDVNDVEGSMPKVLDYVAKFFGDGGDANKTITAASQFWDGIEQILNQYGLSAKNTASSTLSSGIKGMSEETANILAGYVNALRQDVSAMRIMQQEFFEKYWEMRDDENWSDTTTAVGNAKRYDLAPIQNATNAILTMQTKFFENYWNSYIQSYTSAYKSLGNIEQDVANIANIQSSISTTLDNFYSKFNKVTNGTERIYIK